MRILFQKGCTSYIGKKNRGIFHSNMSIFEVIICFNILPQTQSLLRTQIFAVREYERIRIILYLLSRKRSICTIYPHIVLHRKAHITWVSAINSDIWTSGMFLDFDRKLQFQIYTFLHMYNLLLDPYIRDSIHTYWIFFVGGFDGVKFRYKYHFYPSAGIPSVADSVFSI